MKQCQITQMLERKADCEIMPEYHGQE